VQDTRSSATRQAARASRGVAMHGPGASGLSVCAEQYPPSLPAEVAPVGWTVPSGPGGCLRMLARVADECYTRGGRKHESQGDFARTAAARFSATYGG